jgi:multidrug efflux pump subunit AcrA (membrane-fusion protein)
MPGRNGQLLKKGDPIVEIDPRDYDAQVRQKKAASDSTKAQAAAAQASVEQQTSLLCGLATSLGFLILARTIQGAGGGALQPVSQAVMLETFPPEKRGATMAVYAIPGVGFSTSIFRLALLRS